MKKYRIVKKINGNDEITYHVEEKDCWKTNFTDWLVIGWYERIEYPTHEEAINYIREKQAKDLKHHTTIISIKEVNPNANN